MNILIVSSGAGYREGGTFKIEGKVVNGRLESHTEIEGLSVDFIAESVAKALARVLHQMAIDQRHAEM